MASPLAYAYSGQSKVKPYDIALINATQPRRIEHPLQGLAQLAQVGSLLYARNKARSQDKVDKLRTGNALAQAMRAASGWTNPDTGQMSSQPGSQPNRNQALQVLAGDPGTAPIAANALAKALTDTPDPIEKWEDIKDGFGRIIAQRNTTTGAVKPVFGEKKTDDRKIIKDAAGRQRYADTKDLVFPDIPEPTGGDFGKSVQGRALSIYSSGPQTPGYAEAVNFLSNPQYIQTAQGLVMVPPLLDEGGKMRVNIPQNMGADSLAQPEPAPIPGQPPAVQAPNQPAAPPQVPPEQIPPPAQPTVPAQPPQPNIVPGFAKPTARQESRYIEAVDKAKSLEQSISTLEQAIELSPKAYEGATAEERASVARNVPFLSGLVGGQEGAVATTELASIIGKQLAQKLRATLGAQFTQKEGEWLQKLEGSAELSQPEREAVWRRGIELLRPFLEQERGIVSQYEKGFGQQYKMTPDELPQPPFKPDYRFNPQTGEIEEVK